MRMLLVEAAQIAVRYDPGMRNEYLHRCQATNRKGAALLFNRPLLDASAGIEDHPYDAPR